MRWTFQSVVRPPLPPAHGVLALKMPDVRYANLWDSIIVDRSIKDRLLRSAALSLRLRAELPFEATALHGLAFLYGPPGTGKTTLARGLAARGVTPDISGSANRQAMVMDAAVWPSRATGEACGRL
jgi:SpoVK/Ycf46/Vps4 family AAA+-type ATPase